jgi:hypothetical protein
LDHIQDHYTHQTPLNVLALLDNWQLTDERPLRKSFARALLRISKKESLDEWLAALPDRASDSKEGRRIQKELEKILEPPEAPQDLPQPLTFRETATRAFDEAFWKREWKARPCAATCRFNGERILIFHSLADGRSTKRGTDMNATFSW